MKFWNKKAKPVETPKPPFNLKEFGQKLGEEMIDNLNRAATRDDPPPETTAKKPNDQP